jgi:hypothetical protein
MSRTLGQQTVVAAQRSFQEALGALAAAGDPVQVMMVDGQLVMPAAAVPEGWRELRVRAPAGMVTLRRAGAQIEVVVFGNAAPDLLALRDRIARALGQP